MIVLLGRRFGVTGVALAWTLRVSLDTAALCWISRRQLPALAPGVDRILIWLLAATAGLALTTLPVAPLPRALLAVAIIGSFLIVAWRTLLSPGERSFALAAIPWRRPARLETSESGD
jgi:hypothetical protein